VAGIIDKTSPSKHKMVSPDAVGCVGTNKKKKKKITKPGERTISDRGGLQGEGSKPLKSQQNFRRQRCAEDKPQNCVGSRHDRHPISGDKGTPYRHGGTVFFPSTK